MPVQVNGKLKDVIRVPAGAGQEDLLDAAMASEKVASAISGKQVRKTIVIPGKMVNIVAG